MSIIFCGYGNGLHTCLAGTPNSYEIQFVTSANYILLAIQTDYGV